MSPLISVYDSHRKKCLLTKREGEREGEREREERRREWDREGERGAESNWISSGWGVEKLICYATQHQVHKWPDICRSIHHQPTRHGFDIKVFGWDLNPRPSNHFPNKYTIFFVIFEFCIMLRIEAKLSFFSLALCLKIFDISMFFLWTISNLFKGQYRNLKI